MTRLPLLATVCNPRCPLLGFLLDLATEPTSVARRADTGQAPTWGPPEPGARQGLGITRARKQGAQGNRRDRRNSAGTPTGITDSTTVGRLRNLTTEFPGPQCPRQQPGRARERGCGRSSKVVTRCGSQAGHEAPWASASSPVKRGNSSSYLTGLC